MFKDFLKEINSLPIKFTIRHYYPFGDTAFSLKDEKLDSRESWDYLRSEHPSFSISEDRSKWLKASNAELHKDGQDQGLIKRAKDILDVLNKLKINSIFSAGSGGAGLEYQIKKLKPEIKMTCSDFSEINIGALKKVFLEADSIIQFDIKNKIWPNVLNNQNALCLIYRVDASFTDSEWRQIFENIHSSGVKNVLYIPTTSLTILSLLIRFIKRINWQIKGKKFVFSGYLRTRKTFESYWESLYSEDYKAFGGLGGFVLKRID
jgi:hypothetical protein